MKPEEKAKELIEKFRPYIECPESTMQSKQCALICVQEIFDLGVFWIDKQLVEDYPRQYSPTSTYEFWSEVKQQIEES